MNVYASKVRCCRRTRWQLGRRETSRVAPEPPLMRSQWNQIQNGSFSISIIISLYVWCVHTHHTYTVYIINYDSMTIDSTHIMSSIISKPFHKNSYLLSEVSLVVLHSHGAANLQHGSLDNVQKLSHLPRDGLEVVPWAQTKHETNGLDVLMHVKKLKHNLKKDWYELILLDGLRNHMFIARQWSEQLFNLIFLVAALDPSDRTQVSLLMTSWQLSKKSPWKYDCAKRSSKSGQFRI